MSSTSATGSLASGLTAGSSGSSVGSDAGGQSNSSGSSSVSSSGNGPDSGAATADSGAGDASAGLGCGSGLAFCDDFDTDTVNSVPAASVWTVVGTQGCSGQGPVQYPVVVDNTFSHSPPNSVKITGGDSCGPVMLSRSAFSNLASATDVYGRFYLRLTSTSTTFDHSVLMTLAFSADGDGGITSSDQSTFLQLASEGAGNATNVFMWQTDDSHVLPDKNANGGSQSTYPMAATWTCVEFHTSSASKAIETWVGSQSFAGLTFPPGVSMVTDQWEAGLPTLPAFTFDSLGFAWIVFSGPSMTLWIDDVALSATGRIGCN
jgi:polysaccharide lyase-like protein